MQDADKIYLNSELFTNDEFKTFILENIENHIKKAGYMHG